MSLFKIKDELVELKKQLDEQELTLWKREKELELRLQLLDLESKVTAAKAEEAWHREHHCELCKEKDKALNVLSTTLHDLSVRIPTFNLSSLGSLKE